MSANYSDGTLTLALRPKRLAVAKKPCLELKQILSMIEALWTLSLAWIFEYSARPAQ